MSWNRLRVAAVSVLLLLLVPVQLAAQVDPPPTEPTPPPAEPKTAPETPPANESKPGFWGDRFALYIEAGGGTGTATQINSSIDTSSTQTAENLFDMDMLVADIAIGWKLPFDRGSFRLEFTGFSEDSSDFQGYGNRRTVSGSTTVPDFNPTWWTLHIANGNLHSVLNPPAWNDTNADSQIQPDEIVYPTTPVLDFQATVPDGFQNRLQTYDFLFLRDFGGRVWSARYTAGLRYLLYEGNVPAGAWLTTGSTDPETGFTDGLTIPILYLREKTSGLGPTGSLELHYNLFKRRLILFGQARFAFVLQNMDVDSGSFVTLVHSENTIFTAPARIQSSTSQAAWNIGGRIGARFQIVDGFHVELYYDLTAYHDTVLLPFEIQVPLTLQQANQGTASLFGTHNLEIDSVRLAAGFQF